MTDHAARDRSRTFLPCDRGHMPGSHSNYAKVSWDMRIHSASMLVVAWGLGFSVLSPIPRGSPVAAETTSQAAGTGLIAAQQSAYAVRLQHGQPADQIRRGYFTLTLLPGETWEVRVVVGNTGTTTLQLADYAVDAAPITMGGVGFRTADERRFLVGTWIVVKPASLVVARGKARLVSATIHVPKGLAPGQYVGGLAFENRLVQTGDPMRGAKNGQKAHAARGSTFSFDVHYRHVIAVVITVPGRQRPAVRVGGATVAVTSWGGTAIVAVRNTGTVLWNGTGTLRIQGPGSKYEPVRFVIETILPGASAQVPVPVPLKALRAGTYHLQVSVRGNSGGARADWKGDLRVPAPRSPSATPVSVHVLSPAYPPASPSATRARP